MVNVSKSQSAKLNKPTVAELRESFINNGKRFDDYFIGTVTYKDGNYTFKATSSDDAYTEEEKTKILENVITDSIPIPDKDGNMIAITKDNPKYLEAYSTHRGNMYGGLSIINDGGDHDKSMDDLNKKSVDTKKPTLKVNKVKNISN